MTSEVITSILQLEIDSMQERHKTGIAILENIGADGPAFGMIGTLIGLVIMLQNLSGGPEQLGKAMAVAILTTFYGAVIANVFAIPIANKLSFRSEAETLKMNIIVAGVLGIVAGEILVLLEKSWIHFFRQAKGKQPRRLSGRRRKRMPRATSV